jgi:hypothetical protein
MMGEDRIKLGVDERTRVTAQRPITLRVDYTRADEDGGVVLPLLFTVQPEFGDGEGYTEKVFDRFRPQTITFSVLEPGSYLVTLRETTHNKWQGRLRLDVAVSSKTQGVARGAPRVAGAGSSSAGGGGGGGFSTAGLRGATGPRGPVGPEGPQGEQGEQGVQGEQGATGPFGGPTGAQGVTGATGPAGAVGQDGVTGATGPAGAAGAQGVTGATGPQGAQGAQGVTGATGPQGATGVFADGDAGDVVVSGGGTALRVESVSEDLYLNGVITPTISADQNDWAPTGFADASVILVTASGASRSITGLSGGATGRTVFLYNLTPSTNSITLSPASGSSLAANRFSLTVAVVLAPLTGCVLRHNGTNWNVLCYTRTYSGDLSEGTGGIGQVAGSSVAFAFSGVTTPSTFTADVSNHAPGASTNTIRMSGDAEWTVHGISSGSSGRWLIIHNVGSFTLRFPDDSSTATAANRFSLRNDEDYYLYPGASMVTVYDSTISRWRIISLGAADLQSAYNNSAAGSAVIQVDLARAEPFKIVGDLTTETLLEFTETDTLLSSNAGTDGSGYDGGSGAGATGYPGAGITIIPGAGGSGDTGEPASGAEGVAGVGGHGASGMPTVISGGDGGNGGNSGAATSGAVQDDGGSGGDGGGLYMHGGRAGTGGAGSPTGVTGDIGPIHIGMDAARTSEVQIADGIATYFGGRVEVNSNTQAFYPPRVTTTSREAMTGLDNGALVFDTTLEELCVYVSGVGWFSIDKTFIV